MIEPVSCAWPEAPPDLAVDRDHVDVWCAALDTPPADGVDAESWLSPAETQRADRFHFPRDRRRFVNRRIVMRALLAAQVGVHPADLAFVAGRYGKLALAPPFDRDGLMFNVSHSHGAALVAITRGREIGVDLERLMPMIDAAAIAERFFSAAEVAAFHALDPGQQLEGFFNCWTRKEAYVKAIGHGLTLPLDAFAVSLAPGEPARLLACDDPVQEDRWTLAAFTPGPDLVAAAVVEGRGWSLRCWHWRGLPAQRHARP